MLEVEDCKSSSKHVGKNEDGIAPWKQLLDKSTTWILLLMVEKMEALRKEGYSSNQGFQGDSTTRGIRFQVNHKVSCVREPREKGNSPPLSPLEGKSNWVTHPSLQVTPSKSNNYQNSNLK
ncbi:PREDICTED: PRUPE_8G027600 [Prunus dulcis]|uniref:PREDICTED: PRUPE_8G027600 n=1 Tax=Prunus dulcis TaxID=3755 RepID=A0A5E4FWD3_PRUDU|nr:PREDICTED: PRUPE_8G027600 [Prunus dulcis]